MHSEIMIVDDNEFIRESVELLFGSVGMQVISVDGGKRCLEQLEKGFRGVILMDVMMPGLDGWDTIGEIVSRGMYNGNIIIMLTAKSEPDRKMEGLQEYVTDYVTKPFNPMLLLDSVRYFASLRKGYP